MVMRSGLGGLMPVRRSSNEVMREAKYGDAG